MKRRIRLRRIGDSHGFVVPKAVLARLGLERAAEMTVESGALVLRRPATRARAGWAESARRIAEQPDDSLVMGEFANEADSALVW